MTIKKAFTFHTQLQVMGEAGAQILGPAEMGSGSSLLVMVVHGVGRMLKVTALES